MPESPKNSPWGKVQSCEEMLPGIYKVSTAGHGGIMVRSDMASTLSPAARKCGFREGGYLNFEEDCQAAVVMRELIDKKLWSIPSRVTDKGKWEESLNRSIQEHNPEYWQAREKVIEKEAKSHKPLIEQLKDRLTVNLSDYHKHIRGFDKSSIIEMASKITAMNDVHRYVESGMYEFQKSDIEFLMQYQNPLEILADRWQERTNDLSDMEFAIYDVCDKRDIGNDYPLMCEKSRSVRDKPEKPSILGQINENINEIQGRSDTKTQKKDGLEH